MTHTQKTYHSNGQIKTIYDTVNGEKHGKFIRYFDNGQIAIISTYVHGKSHGQWKEYYENGQIAEEGEYIDGEYHVTNFWVETGDQLLVNGTGKVIRKYSPTEGEVFEQYFDNGKFTVEKKISGASYGKFMRDAE